MKILSVCILAATLFACQTEPSSVAPEKSRRIAQEPCDEMKSQLARMREEHVLMNEELQEMVRHHKLCLSNNSDKSIGEGACDAWEKEMDEVRKIQSRIYREFERLESEYARECGGE